MENVSDLNARREQKRQKTLPKLTPNGTWIPYDGRVQLVWKCGCGSSLMQVVEGIGTQCVVCETVVMPL
ncbi:hypothetical protein [uncultured Endozoicomonas sp.]|uniref:hypothetical protein n=1 Tax=uncultured Endozoicomonas sp. TaxID=432652 RepID=UPI002622C302|nr:hypothetical protein [uncultured Endozoicomonas sp.]